MIKGKLRLLLGFGILIISIILRLFVKHIELELSGSEMMEYVSTMFSIIYTASSIGYVPSVFLIVIGTLEALSDTDYEIAFSDTVSDTNVNSISAEDLKTYQEKEIEALKKKYDELDTYKS